MRLGTDSVTDMRMHAGGNSVEEARGRENGKGRSVGGWIGAEEEEETGARRDGSVGGIPGGEGAMRGAGGGGETLLIVVDN